MLYRIIDVFIFMCCVFFARSLDRHGSPYELYSLVKLEEKCEERLEFYGSHDPLELVKHPTALYSMYKRWAGLKESNTTAGCYNSTDIKAMMPNKDDLTEMGLNLFRLQFTYNLSVSDMMSGNISGRMSPWPLDVSDCLRIADITHEDMKPDGFNVWHSACSAMEGYDPDKEVPPYPEKKALYTQLLDLVEKVDMQTILTAKAESANWLVRAKRLKDPTFSKLLDRYRDLCVQGSDRAVFETSQHKCFFDLSTSSNPLAPDKIEILSQGPLVAIFHDAVSTQRIEQIKEASVANLGVPSELSTSSNKTFSNSARTGKIAFLTDEAVSPHLRYGSAPELIKHMKMNSGRLTGLETENGGVEMLQVVSYGIGGLYEPHRDAFGLNSINATGSALQTELRRFGAEGRGDRIATLIYYLEEIKQENGGGTVFPDLGIAAFPTKGSALFWFNLDKNGMMYQESIHAGCPVLYGSKWISNHWFREHAQMLKRPCLPR